LTISDDYARLPTGEIVVKRDERQRRIIKTDDLLPSIKERGVMNPIIVTRDKVLIAGERRLATSIELGLRDIPVRYADSLTETELAIVELEENIKRADLEWQELVDAVASIHKLYCQADKEWPLRETAASIGLTIGTVSMYLQVHNDLADTRIKEAGTVREAYNVLKRREHRSMGDALQELLETTATVVKPDIPSPQTSTSHNASSSEGTSSGAVGEAPAKREPAPLPILNLSFLDWVKTYEGPKFNLVHCDFPYGVNLFDGAQGKGAEEREGYSDTEDVYFTLLESFLLNLDKFMSVSAHLMFWYSAKHRDKTEKMFSELAPSLSFSTHPLIWLKSDNAGIAADYLHQPRHIYETCSFAYRHKRQLVRIAADAYSSPTDKRLHPSTKPEPMLRHFMSMLVDESTTMFDPTCGSGASLRAADSLGAKTVFGLEIDKEYADNANQALSNARKLRSASASGL
jgi:ParB/RepB/Spo0J family partition protein